MPDIRGLSFYADGECYAVDVALVRKIARKIEVTPIPAAPDAVVGIANMKGRVVTVLSVSALLGRKRDGGAEAGPRAVNAVVFKASACGGEQMGLLVDSPGDLIEIDEDRVSSPPLAEGAEAAPLPISGVYESGGTLYRILSIDSIISRFQDGGCAAAPGPRGGSIDEDAV